MPTVRGVALSTEDMLEYVSAIEAGGSAAARRRPPAVQRILSSKVRHACCCGVRCVAQLDVLLAVCVFFFGTFSGLSKRDHVWRRAVECAVWSTAGAVVCVSLPFPVCARTPVVDSVGDVALRQQRERVL